MRLKFVNLLLFSLLIVILSGCVAKEKVEQDTLMEISKTKKAVLIIAKQGFQDVEYNGTRKALEHAGIDIVVASSSEGTAVGKFGQEIEVDVSLDNINVKDFDAIVFIGGPGATEYVNSPLAHQLAMSAVDNNRILGAICIAPMILANAGVLDGKKATVWSDPLDQSPIEILKNNKAEYVDQALVVDENLVTANGPSAARQFGEKIAELLK